MARRYAAQAVLALTLSASMAMPNVAFAAGPAASDVDTSEVRRLFEEGRAKFDTMDYQGAIDLWTRAYAGVPANEENRNIRNNLVYNIATAQEKAFELDGDPTHLRQAKGLLERYVAEFKAIYQPTNEARTEVKKVESRIAELDARLAGAGAGPAPGAPAPAAAPPTPQLSDDQLRQQEYKRLLREDPQIRPQYKSGTGMIAGGSVCLGLGAISLIVMFSFLAVRATDEALDPTTDEAEPVGTTGAIVSGVMAGGLITTGSVLLGFGVSKRKRAKRAARERAGLALGPGGLGLRF